MKIKVGDKILLKKVEDLPEDVKLIMSMSDSLKDYEKKFAGKECTVSEILRKRPLVIEIEEDEDSRSFDNLITSVCADYDNLATKKHHFSEKYIEKVLTKHPETEDSETEDSETDYPDEDSENTHSFGWALDKLKEGLKVARKGWNGKGLWLELQKPDAHSKMTLPYVYMNYPKGDKYHDGCRVPWLASQTDMLEEDWYEVE